MKYEVELRRESYITYTVEADNPDEAEAKAWEQLAADGADTGYASWSVESVEWIEEQE